MPDDVLPLAQVTFSTAVAFGGQSSFSCGASGEVTVELDLAKRLVMLKNSRRKESLLVPLSNVAAMKPTKAIEPIDVKVAPARAVDLSAEQNAMASLPKYTPPEDFEPDAPATVPNLPPIKAKYPKAKK